MLGYMFSLAWGWFSSVSSTLWSCVTGALDSLNLAICWAGRPGSRRNSDALPLGIPLALSKVAGVKGWSRWLWWYGGVAC